MQATGSASCRFSVSNAEMQDLTPARFRASLYAVAVESLVKYTVRIYSLNPSFSLEIQSLSSLAVCYPLITNHSSDLVVCRLSLDLTGL
jgi:hypothetical protein